MGSNENPITKLPNKVYDEVISQIIRNNFKTPIEKLKVIYSTGSSKGDNYVGYVYRIQVYEEEESEPKLNIIAKLSPVNETKRSELQINQLFGREAEFYDKIYPIYKKFQEEKGINISKDGFYETVFCFKTLIEEPYEGLFFEDLKALNFEMFDRFKDLTENHVFMVMKALAKMHALFFAIRDQKPELVEIYTRMQDFFILLCERKNNPLGTWFESMKEQAYEFIDEIDDKDQLTKIKRIVDKNIYDLAKNWFNPQNTEPYATICHGDCWNNNMMFRHDKNGYPTDLRLLDFQIVRYASPVFDILYYIFGCTTKKLRDKHYQNFLDTYYSTLSSFIKRLGSDPEKMYPHHVFNEHLKKFGHFGLIMGILTIPFFTSNPEDAPDMDKIAENLKKIGDGEKVTDNAFNIVSNENRGKYAERLLGVCKDMCELGYV